jgi:hypothetical protein
MDKEYKDLLVRSIEATETSTQALKILADTSKVMNDTLLSHNNKFIELCAMSKEGNEISRANNVILIKYLKWAVAALVVTLGGAKVFEIVKIL